MSNATNMTNYRIRGYTGASPDFDFTWTANTNSLFGLSLRDAILRGCKLDSLWSENFDTIDIDFNYELGPDSERADLREVDSQRVYLVNSIYCNRDQDIFDIEHDCNEGDCDTDVYMVTVDIAE